MTVDEARAYFIDCNERIISVAKDENIYNYKTQQVEDVFMRRTFEANELAIKALEQDPQETVTEFADRCRECGKMKRCKDCKYFEYENEVGEVLDEIKAEIEKKHARAKQMSSVLQMNAYIDCLQIIDKYIAEGSK